MIGPSLDWSVLLWLIVSLSPRLSGISSKRNRNRFKLLKKSLKTTYFRSKTSFIYILLLVFTLLWAVNMYTKAEIWLNRHETIRKWWKKRWKTRNAIVRKCQQLSLLWTYRRGSNFFSVCELHTYMIEETLFCQRLFSKNIFSDANLLYESRLFMAC